MHHTTKCTGSYLPRRARACAAALLALLLLVSIFSPCALAASSAVEASGTQRVMRVGYFQFDGYHEMDEDGNRSGYGYELLQRIARYENITYEYVGYDASWQDMLKMLADGEIDFVSSARKTDERAQLYDFSERNIGTRSTVVAVRAGNNDIVAGDYSTYDGMTVGMLESNTRNESFAKFAQERGFTYTAKYYNSAAELKTALETGEVDSLVSSSFRTSDDEWIVSAFDEEDVYIITRKGDTETMAVINDALEKLDLYEAGWRLELDEKYYGDTASTEINLSRAEARYLEQLATSGSKLQVAVNPDRYPYSYVGDDGQLTGIMVDMFAEIAQRLGLSYEICQTQTRQDYVDLLKTGTVDICLDMHEDMSNAEKYGFKITDIYISAPFSWVMLKGFSGEPKTMATVGASAAKTTKMDDDNVFGVSSYVYCDSFDDCLTALRAGEVDAFYTYTYNAEKIVYEDEHNDLKTRLSSGVSYFCIGVRQDIDVALLDALNKGVASLSDHDTELITEKYTSLGELSFSVVRLTYQYPAVVALLIVCFVFMAVCVALTLRARRFKRAAEAASQKAIRADKAKTSFLANMSHDIRTPINGIMGMLEISRAHIDDTAKVSECLDKMQSAARHLLSLINDVLDMSKIEAGAIEFDEVPFDIRELIAACCSIVEGQQLDSGVNLVCETGNITHPYLLGSELYIRRILINILGNAFKYTPAGGTITLNAYETGFNGGYAAFSISVADTGVGISDEFMERLFDPFTQENSGSRSNYTGTGLGLAISKRLAEQMGGTLTAVSMPEKGSTFTFTVALPTTAAPDHSAAELGAVSLDGVRVLLAEDNELNREIAVTLLEESGCTVTAVADGEQAVAAFAAAPAGFDVILMDMMMPNMDGLEATRQIRKREGKTPETGVPIIAMTANVFADDVHACLNAGMNSHVGKPIDMKRLASEIARLTSQHQ